MFRGAVRNFRNANESERVREKERESGKNAFNLVKRERLSNMRPFRDPGLLRERERERERAPLSSSTIKTAGTAANSMAGVCVTEPGPRHPATAFEGFTRLCNVILPRLLNQG